MNSMRIRMMQASCWDTYTMHHDHVVPVALRKELEQYRGDLDEARAKELPEEVKTALKLVGSPTASMTMAFLEALVTMDIGAKCKKAVSDYITAVQPVAQDGAMVEPTITRAKIEEQVHLIKLERCKDESRVKLLISAPHWDLLPVVREAMAAADDNTLHRGVGPAGWMEDELSTWLEALVAGEP